MGLRFQTGGTLRPDAFYVERPADGELLATLRRGEFCYVLAPRQIGKSSLRLRIELKLRQEGILCGTVDLTRIGSSEVTADEWYRSLADEIERKLRLSLDVGALWQSNAGISPVHRFSRFIQDGLLQATRDNVVLFIDEIDAVLTLPFRMDDFFAALRAFYNDRADDPAFQRLTFCLLGAAAPADLIQDPTRTPFNIGVGIRLNDFTAQEATALLPGLNRRGADPEALLKEIMVWTSGHPYMTQRVCEALVKHEILASTTVSVANLVRELFLLRGRVEDPNLAYAEKRLLGQSGTRARDMLCLYQRMLEGEPIQTEGENSVQTALRLSGLGADRMESGVMMLRVRNRIFASVFNKEWCISAAEKSLGRYGDYEALRMIGRGGLSNVYEGINILTKQRVAIRVLHPVFVNRRASVVRFLREAQVVGTLKHPNVATAFDSGQQDDGTPYLIMEYVEGVGLDSWAQDRPLAEFIEVGVQIAQALAVTHAQSIIHRDLKPTNIMIATSPEGRPIVKVLDFGISKTLNVHDEQFPDINTADGEFFGTPVYMAPEQIRDSGRVSSAADVYSLGVIFYQIVGRRLPFQGASVHQLLAATLLTEPPPLGLIARSTPAGLVALIHAMLRKDATQRPTMRQVALTLQALADGNAFGAELAGHPPLYRSPWLYVPVSVLVALLLLLSLMTR